MSDAQLDYSGRPGEWTIRQIVHHLVDGTLIWSVFFNRAIGTPGESAQFAARFPGNDEWAAAMEFEKRPVKAAVALVVAHHQFLAEAAGHFSDAWDREVEFPASEGRQGRKMTAGQIISMLGEHLVEHVNMIEDIKQRHGI